MNNNNLRCGKIKRGNKLETCDNNLHDMAKKKKRKEKKN